MNILRDSAEAAVNHVVRCAREAADLYEDAVARADEDAVREFFEYLARERHALAARLEPHVRSMGALPAAPDPDSEALHRLFNAARALFADSEDRVLIEDRARAEERLAMAVDAACEEEISESLRGILDDARERIDLVRRRLRDSL